jgi:hypothetical protein
MGIPGVSGQHHEPVFRYRAKTGPLVSYCKHTEMHNENSDAAKFFVSIQQATLSVTARLYLVVYVWLFNAALLQAVWYSSGIA